MMAATVPSFFTNMFKLAQSHRVRIRWRSAEYRTDLRVRSESLEANSGNVSEGRRLMNAAPFRWRF
jgi:hypothetical protein